MNEHLCAAAPPPLAAAGWVGGPLYFSSQRAQLWKGQVQTGERDAPWRHSDKSSP